ncbi:MAG: hypothetical protein EA407_03980 [Rhodobacteraceae bacterium]|nr:MAG: hypothetical protein EA407_03980 [Paracoccaceae bacterium]
MSENIDNMMLEQLRLIREDLNGLRDGMQSLETRMDARFDDIETELQGHRMMIFGLSSVIGQIDKRVEHLETKIGG